MGNEKGQVLLPGLAVFLFASFFTITLIFYARHILLQMRVDTAAQATALSAARAQAEMLNKFASYNLVINPMIFPKYKTYAGLQVAFEDEYEMLQEYQSLWEFHQFQIFPYRVGVWVARANGCKLDAYIPTPSQLFLQDVEAILMDGIYPIIPPVLLTLEKAFYVRTLGPDQRRAQPPHQTYWRVSRDGVKGYGAARLYLDVDPGDKVQNGGFPSSDPEHFWDDVQIQSCYPQFNAVLLPRTKSWIRAILDAMS